jgi:hypothetical protein
MGFGERQARLRVLEALEARARQFRSRDGIWPFRVLHEPLDLAAIIEVMDVRHADRQVRQLAPADSMR